MWTRGIADKKNLKILPTSYVDKNFISQEVSPETPHFLKVKKREGQGVLNLPMEDERCV